MHNWFDVVEVRNGKTVNSVGPFVNLHDSITYAYNYTHGHVWQDVKVNIFPRDSDTNFYLELIKAEHICGCNACTAYGEKFTHIRVCSQYAER